MVAEIWADRGTRGGGGGAPRVLGPPPPPPKEPPAKLVVKGNGLRSPWVLKAPDSLWAQVCPECFLYALVQLKGLVKWFSPCGSYLILSLILFGR